MITDQDSAAGAAREARDHPALDRLARAGMITHGVVYLLVGWLAAQLAVGRPQGSASGEGALKELAQQPLGAVALWLACAGFAALALWEACQAVGGHRAEEGVRRWGARAGSAGRAVVFGALAVLAVRTATDPASGGSGGERGLTAQVMRLPLGQALVVAIGLGICVIALIGIHTGVTDRWRKGLEADGLTGKVGRIVTVFARAGHVSRGVAFLVVGGLFVWAGVTHDAKKSGGLDQAIVRLRDEPFGPWLMVVVAIGLGCYGVYHVLRGWYLRGS